MSAPPRSHWVVRNHRGRRIGTADRRKTAINLADGQVRPLRLNARVEHPNGEIWQRRDGSWFKLAERVRKRDEDAA